MIAVALPSIGTELAVDLPLATGLLVTTYIIVNLICQSPGGKLADALGRWRMVETGMLVFAAGAILGAVATGIWMLSTGRVLMAVGGALTGPSALAILRNQVAPERRGRIYGLYGATQSLAAAIGPAVGGELVEALGWRAIFYVSVPLIALALILARLSGRPQANVTQTRRVRDVMLGFDWAGTALLAVSLVSLGMAIPMMLLVGAAAAAAFVVWERRIADPLLQPRMFANRIFAAACLIIALQAFTMYGLMFQLPQFFDVISHASARETGHLLLAMMLALFVTSMAGGALGDRFGPRMVCLGGAGLIFAGVAWLLRLSAASTPGDAFVGLVLVGLGLGIAWPPAQAAAMSSIDEAQSGLAAGVSSTSRYLGGALGVLMFSAIVAHGGAGNVQTHRVIIDIFLAAIAISAAACLLLPGTRRVGKPA